MLSDKDFRNLDDKGYTVVENVITKLECDQAINEYKQWLANFGESFPKSFNSIVNDYNIGHQETTWRLRLRCKPVFAQLWKTEKLLTSFDAVAIGRPPESGFEAFQVPGRYWLHADTTVSRVGLHAYQGSLYLEEQTKNDWTFQVIEGSHKHLNELLSGDPKRAEVSQTLGFYYKLQDGDVEYFENRGCRVLRVPVPKGGMVLWDSRLVHANARPMPKRRHAGRWRWLTFVSMTPAIWASKEDIKKQQEAYNKPSMTTHWSSQGIRLLESAHRPGIPHPDTVPDIARTPEAMSLSSMLPYDFADGQPNGPDFTPVWKKCANKLPPELDLETQYANGHI